MSKKCTKCNLEMRKGFHFRGLWVEGRPDFGKRLSKLAWWPRKRDAEDVSCYMCPKCGAILFEADINKQ